MPRSEETRLRVFEAISLGRQENLYARTAAARAGTTIPTIRKYAPEVIRPGPLGRLEFTSADRLSRTMHVTTTEGDEVLTVRGSRAATTVAQHANAVRYYLSTGDVSVLDPYRGKRVAGKVLETDPDKLDQMARAGDLEWLSIYEGRTA